MPSAPLTVVVLTYNERENITDCLASLSGVEDVHVLDSGSTDGTVEAARQAGAHIHYHPFESFGKQRNWAIDNIEHRYPWALHLDADERMTDALHREIADRLAEAPQVGGFHVPSRTILAGRWLRHAGGYPTYQVRLFHLDRLRFTDYGHGQREVTHWPLGKLEQPYDHHAFSKGLDHWFAKHAVYARLEAEQAMREKSAKTGSNLSNLFGDSITRRRSLKRLTYRLPMRPTLRLLDTLLIKRGLLDGSIGITYARMLAAYETMFQVNHRLLRNAAATKPTHDHGTRDATQ